MSRDKELRKSVKGILDADMRTANYDLKVTVNDGLAQVTGIVDTLAEKEQVDQILSDIKELKGFDNGVSISTDGSIIDEDVEEEVTEELNADPAVNLRHVGARSVKGNVFLVGTVYSPEEEKAAIRAASRARGVRSVVSQLKVNRNGYDVNSLEAIFHHQVNNDKENRDRKDFI